MDKQEPSIKFKRWKDVDLSYEQYVDLMTMFLSDDRAAIAEANRLLFVLLVTGKDARRIPAVALHEIETKLEKMRRSQASS